MFHFNKKHLEDPTIPMWVVKAQGETYYVEHVNCSVSWSTKETPDNSHTKGSIKIKRCLVTIDDDNVATISELTLQDVARLKKRNAVRIITSYGARLMEALKAQDIRHGPIKQVSGGCGTSWYITDILQRDRATLFLLGWSGPKDSIRILKENEPYFKMYDDTHGEFIPEIEDDDDYEDLYES